MNLQPPANGVTNPGPNQHGLGQALPLPQQQPAPPAIGGAAIAPQGQVPAVVGPPAQVPRTFATYFQETNHDPLRNTWAQVLRRFDDAGTDADTLLTAAVNMPVAAACAYLCCMALHPNTPPRVFVIHSLSRFPPAALDGVATPWDNQLLGCLGDVLQDNIATVRLPDAAFNLTAYSCVYTEAALPNQLALLQAQGHFPQLGATIADSELLRTRSLMYLPARFAHLFLHT
jgi:hypothetical protein